MRRRVFIQWFVPGAIVAALLGISLPQSAHATDATPENVVKAAYLRSFAKYVTWPEATFADRSSPFVIGVLGQDPFQQLLEKTVEGQMVQNRRFGVQRFPVVDGELPSTEALRGIHVLFVSSSERQRLPQIFERLRGTNVMTVSDVPNFAENGGIAEFVLVGANIKLRFNLQAAEDAGLQASARLLRLVFLVESKQ